MMCFVALDFLEADPDMPDEELAALVLRVAGGWLPDSDDGKEAAMEAVRWARRQRRDDPDGKKMLARMEDCLRSQGMPVTDYEAEMAKIRQRSVGAATRCGS